MERFIAHRLPLIAAVLLSLFTCLAFPSADSTVSAKTGSASGADVVFVVDTSHSMNETDPEKLAIEMMKMLIDASDFPHTRIGLVAYNEKIVESHPLTPLSSQKEAAPLKKKIGSLVYQGYSDLGLGLRSGVDLLNQKSDGTRKPLIILLSDGDTNLNPALPDRTLEDANRDVDQAIKQAKANGYPIYTIGIHARGKINRPQLEHIAAKTGGTSIITNRADDLSEFLDGIVSRHMGGAVQKVATVRATGNPQEVTIPVGHSSTDLGVILLGSRSSLYELQLMNSSGEAVYSRSKKFSLIQVVQPVKGSLLTRFKAKPGDVVTVRYIGYSHVQAGVEVDTDRVEKGKPATITASIFRSADGKPLTDPDFIAKLKAELRISHLKTRTEKRLAMNREDHSFAVEISFAESGRYEGIVVITGPSVYRESPVTLDVGNQAPGLTGASTISLAKEDGAVAVDLDTLFQDPNGDPLAYSLASPVPGSLVKADIRNGSLAITPVRTGTWPVTVTAKDDEGAAVQADLEIEVYSVWDRYVLTGGIVLLMLILVRMAYAFARPPQLSGRLECTFVHTASGSTLPVKYWTLASFAHKRRVSLRELFASLDIHEHLPETEHMSFHAGKPGTILFKNKTGCLISASGAVFSTHKKIALKHNDIVHIVFEDGLTEIQVRYIEAKPFATEDLRVEEAESYRQPS